MESGDFAAADEVLLEAVDAAEKLGDARVGATARLALLLLRLRSSETEEWSEEAKDELEQTIAVFERPAITPAWRRHIASSVGPTAPSTTSARWSLP